MALSCTEQALIIWYLSDFEGYWDFIFWLFILIYHIFLLLIIINTILLYYCLVFFCGRSTTTLSWQVFEDRHGHRARACLGRARDVRGANASERGDAGPIPASWWIYIVHRMVMIVHDSTSRWLEVKKGSERKMGISCQQSWNVGFWR